MEKKLLVFLLRRWRARILALEYTTERSATLDYIDGLLALGESET